MASSPDVILGERFALLHDRFEVNTQLVANVLESVGFEEREIDAFELQFEDRFVIPILSRIRSIYGSMVIVRPGKGWTERGENGLHVTGMDDEGKLVHATPLDYGETILHEIGHHDLDRRKPNHKICRSRQERIADRFMRKNSLIAGDLVDFTLSEEGMKAMQDSELVQRWS